MGLFGKKKVEETILEKNKEYEQKEDLKKEQEGNLLKYDKLRV